MFLDGDDNFSKFSRNSQMDLLFPRSCEMWCESTGNSVNKPHYWLFPSSYNEDKTRKRPSFNIIYKGSK